jgi:hypothetical protein
MLTQYEAYVLTKCRANKLRPENSRHALAATGVATILVTILLLAASNWSDSGSSVPTGSSNAELTHPDRASSSSADERLHPSSTAAAQDRLRR